MKPLCPHCGNRSQTTDYCSNCSRPIAPGQGSTVTAPRPIPTAPPHPSATLPGEELANLLTTLALIILVTGLLFAMYVWGEYGTISSGGFFGETRSISNPFGKIAAFAIAANSVIWSALLGGVSRTIRNTLELSGQIAQLRAKQA